VLVASNENGLEVIADKNEYMFKIRDQNARRNHSIKNDNSSFAKVEEFKYLPTTVTNQNSIPEEIKSRVKSGSTCYNSVQNLYHPVCYQKFKD
jgi:hypothetical protein